MGWRIRHGVDIGTTGLLVIGGLVATVARVVVDLAMNHHSKRRPERG